MFQVARVATQARRAIVASPAFLALALHGTTASAVPRTVHWLANKTCVAVRAGVPLVADTGARVQARAVLGAVVFATYDLTRRSSVPREADAAAWGAHPVLAAALRALLREQSAVLSRVAFGARAFAILASAVPPAWNPIALCHRAELFFARIPGVPLLAVAHAFDAVPVLALLGVADRNVAVVARKAVVADAFPRAGSLLALALAVAIAVLPAQCRFARKPAKTRVAQAAPVDPARSAVGAVFRALNNAAVDPRIARVARALPLHALAVLVAL